MMNDNVAPGTFPRAASPAPDDYIPDVREVLMTLWRRRLMIVAIGAAVMLAGTPLIMMKAPNYKANATVMISQQDLNNSLKDFQDVTQGQKFDDMTVQTEIGIMTSPSLALQVVKATDLGKTKEFAADNDQAVVSSFLGHLDVQSQGSSRIINVGFKAHDPVLAAKVANALVAAYLNEQTEFKKQQVEKLGQWFQSRVEQMKAAVAQKAKAVSDFRAENGLIVGKDAQELVYQQISDVSAQIAPVQQHQDDIQSKLSSGGAAAKSARPGAIIDVVQSPLIQTLKAQESALSQQVESLSAQYGANHPKLVAARGQLADVRKAIATESANIRSALKNDGAASVAQEEMLKRRLNDLQQQANDIRSKMITLNALQQEQDASQKLLDSFLANYETVQSQLTFARPDAVVVSKASPPLHPVQPGKTLLMAVLILFAGCAALAGVFITEMMRGGVRNFEDLRKLGQKPVGVLPYVANPALALSDNGSSYKEALKRIYMSTLMDGQARTILVTSAVPGEGRTTFVTSMGQYLASLGHKVLVIDADFMKPDLGRLAGPSKGPGLTDVLSGKATLPQAFGRDDHGLDVLRAGTLNASPDILRSTALSDLLDQLRQRYAYVLIDSSPLLAHSEAGLIAAQADGVLVVTEWVKTPEQALANMFTTLSYLPVPVLGVVMNKVDLGKYKTVSAAPDFLLPKIAHAA